MYGIRGNGKRVIITAIIATFVLATACAFGFLNTVGKASAFVYAEGSDDELVKYDGAVEHIFTHELIFDTAKGFAKSNPMRDCFDKDHLTAAEFSLLLDELYKNGYALISLDRALSGEPLMLPQGKRPLVMSFDDMTYDTVNRGCIDKLVLIDGVVYDYTKNAEPQLTRERENITILESFIEQHPDFSIDGARATLCVNGYNGILGYRITPDCKVDDKRMTRDTEECKKLVAELKRLGYTFASHTYYHSYFNSSSYGTLQKDCKRWKQYVEPIVGETRILCYPAGQHSAKSAKNDIFKEYGFNVFLCVGSFAGTDHERASTDAVYVYRKPFDGTALRLYGKQYAHLADTRAIYDTTRFRPFSYKGGYY